ncbi:MAG: hypothetical protein KR126chlam1_00379 [Chlamydiae bacterium]|nr:hypothetical protein [Chlamydiota bacterium]
MATVQSNLPFSPLEPIPIPKEIGTRLRNVVSSVALVATVVFFTASFGAWLSMAGMGFSATKGAIGGALIGIVVGIIGLSQMNFSSPLADYRIKTLEQIDATISDPRAKEAIRRLKEFFRSSLTRLAHPYTHHMLHKELTLVTDHVDPNREDLQKVWRPFIENIHETKISDFEHNPITLDLSWELDRGNKQKLDPEARWLNSKEEDFEKAIEQIDALQKVSFYSEERIPAQELKKEIEEGRRHCLVIEQKEGGNLLGYALIRLVEIEEQKVFEISALARKPEAVGLWIGSHLLQKVLQKVLQKLPPEAPAQVTLSKKNPATTLFAKFGFKLKNELSQERVLLERIATEPRSSE